MVRRWTVKVWECPPHRRHLSARACLHRFSVRCSQSEMYELLTPCLLALRRPGVSVFWTDSIGQSYVVDDPPPEWFQ